PCHNDGDCPGTACLLQTYDVDGEADTVDDGSGTNLHKVFPCSDEWSTAQFAIPHGIGAGATRDKLAIGCSYTTRLERDYGLNFIRRNAFRPDAASPEPQP